MFTLPHLSLFFLRGLREPKHSALHGQTNKLLFSLFNVSSFVLFLFSSFVFLDPPSVVFIDFTYSCCPSVSDLPSFFFILPFCFASFLFFCFLFVLSTFISFFTPPVLSAVFAFFFQFLILSLVLSASLRWRHFLLLYWQCLSGAQQL